MPSKAFYLFIYLLLNRTQSTRQTEKLTK